MVLLFCSASILLGASARGTLEEAFAKAEVSSITAEFTNPVKSYHGKRWIFKRLYRNGKLFLRLEIYNGGELIESYVKNDLGEFGTDFDGYSAKIIHIPYLWHPELIAKPLHELEISEGDFSMSNFDRNGIPCWKISVSVPKTKEFLMRLTGDWPQFYDANRGRYMEKKAFRYEFIIDKSSLQIYNRKHFNSKGKLIFELDLGSVTQEETDIEEFDAPFWISGTYLTAASFAQRNYQEMLDRGSGFAEKLPYLLSRIVDRIFRYGHYFTISIAVIAIAGILIVKHSVNRAYKRSTHKAYKRR